MAGLGRALLECFRRRPVAHADHMVNIDPSVSCLRKLAANLKESAVPCTMPRVLGLRRASLIGAEAFMESLYYCHDLFLLIAQVLLVRLLNYICIIYAKLCTEAP